MKKTKTCKTCQKDKDPGKDFRQGRRQCKICEKEIGAKKRKDRWDFLGLDMSKTF